MRFCIFTYAPNAYGTRRLAEAIVSRRHEAIIVSPLDCMPHITSDRRCIISGNTALENIDVVFPRCMTYFHQGRTIPGSVEAASALTLVSNGALSINDPLKKTISSNKILSLVLLSSNGLPVPPTFFLSSPSELVPEMLPHPYVAKLIDGTWGMGVMQLDSVPALHSVQDAFCSLGHSLLVQPLLHDNSTRHIRALILNGQLLAAYETVPKAGDFRGNINAGAAARQVTLTDEVAQVAIKSVETLGLIYAGVDVISTADGIFVIEVNSSPGFEFADTLPGVNFAESLVVFAENHVDRQPAASSTRHA